MEGNITISCTLFCEWEKNQSPEKWWSHARPFYSGHKPGSMEGQQVPCPHSPSWSLCRFLSQHYLHSEQSWVRLSRWKGVCGWTQCMIDWLAKKSLDDSAFPSPRVNTRMFAKKQQMWNADGSGTCGKAKKIAASCSFVAGLVHLLTALGLGVI